MKKTYVTATADIICNSEQDILTLSILASGKGDTISFNDLFGV